MPEATPSAPPPPALLFVDDEPMVRRGMQRLIKQLSPTWDLRFEADGATALASLAGRPADVVVTDMHMGAMDGASFLGRVRDLLPDAVRIVLTGDSKPELVHQSLAVAHQFLRKGMDPARLVDALQRACELRATLTEPELRRLVAGDNHLPSTPHTYAALQQAASDPKATVRDFAQIIERDVGAAGRVLHLASSAFFGLPSHVTNIEGAITYLGLGTIRTLILSVEVFRMFDAQHRVPGFRLEKLQRHSLRVARLASGILAGHAEADEALLAGLLHDVGVLIVASRTPERFQRILSAMETDGVSFLEAEQGVLGANHADLGAYLLSLWDVHPGVIHAVAHHHRTPTNGQLDVTSAVYVANRLDYELARYPPEEELDDLARSLGLGHLDRVRALRDSMT